MPFPKSLAVRFALGFGIGFIGLGVAVGAYVVVSAERPEDASLQSGLPNPTIQPVVSAAAPTRPAGAGTTTMPAGLDFNNVPDSTVARFEVRWEPASVVDWSTLHEVDDPFTAAWQAVVAAIRCSAWNSFSPSNGSSVSSRFWTVSAGAPTFS